MFRQKINNIFDCPEKGKKTLITIRKSTIWLFVWITCSMLFLFYKKIILHKFLLSDLSKCMSSKLETFQKLNPKTNNECVCYNFPIFVFYTNMLRVLQCDGVGAR